MGLMLWPPELLEFDFTSQLVGDSGGINWMAL